MVTSPGSVPVACAQVLAGARWQVMIDPRIWRHVALAPHAATELLDQLVQADPRVVFQAERGPMPDGELWVACYTRSIGRVDGLTDARRPGLFIPKPVS